MSFSTLIDRGLFLPGLFIYVFFCFSAHASSPLKVEIAAKAAIMINAQTGAVLYEKNAHQSMYPASITKILTALYAIEKKGYALEESMMASAEAVAAVHPHVKRASNSKHPGYRLEFGGSSMGIKIGEVLTFRALLYGLMLASGNDAANVIAEFVSGSVCQFLQELNVFAKNIGCAQTIFHTPHGLPHAEHKTTAFDMAIMAKEAMRHPLFREIVKTASYKRPVTNLQPESLLQQHNALVRPGGKFYYPKAMGIKTGYTAAGGYTLVAAAEDSQRRLIAVLLGCDNLEQRYRDAIALFEAAFKEEKASRTLFSKDFDVFSTDVLGGKNGLQAQLGDDLVVDYYPSEAQVFHSKVVWKDCSLPIQKQDVVAEVSILTDDGHIVNRSALYAKNEVEPTLTYVLRVKYKACKKMLYTHQCIILSLFGCMLLGAAFFLHGIRKKMKKR